MRNSSGGGWKPRGCQGVLQPAPSRNFPRQGENRWLAQRGTQGGSNSRMRSGGQRHLGLISTSSGAPAVLQSLFCPRGRACGANTWGLVPGALGSMQRRSLPALRACVRPLPVNVARSRPCSQGIPRTTRVYRLSEAPNHMTYRKQ